MEQQNNTIQNNYQEWQNNTPNWKERMAQIKKKKDEEATQFFETLGIGTLVYALILTLCLYKNLYSFTCPIFSISTAAYMHYISKRFGHSFHGINYFLAATIALLGFSNFLTANYLMIFYNYLAIIILFVINFILIFFDLKEINLLGHICFIMKYAFESLEQIPLPFDHLFRQIKRRKTSKSERTKYIIMGVVITIPVFLIVYWLLSSADAVFQQVFSIDLDWLNLEFIIENTFGILLTFALSYAIPYALVISLDKTDSSKVKSVKKNYNPIIPIILGSSLSLLYVTFSVIQIVFLFMQAGTLPEGYTYAEYAREGFFQLLFLSISNAFAILIGMELFRSHKVLKVLLLTISGCTFIMIASSAYRMMMYIDNYGLTSYRIFVLWGLLVIFLLLLGLVYQMFVKKFSLFNYALIVSSLCFMVLSFSHYDYWIAHYNFARYEAIQQHQLSDDSKHQESEDSYEEEADAELLFMNNRYVDYEYFLDLSEDAAPIMADHLDELFQYMKTEKLPIHDAEWYPYKKHGKRKMSLRTFNLSRYLAEQKIPTGYSK
ncbi:MAG: DUF4173 domain-containing protein [Eubacterium sp.]|nr:DUF4173 domain-containing protein [Eubacterium sp.]